MRGGRDAGGKVSHFPFEFHFLFVPRAHAVTCEMHAICEVK